MNKSQMGILFIILGLIVATFGVYLLYNKTSEPVVKSIINPIAETQKETDAIPLSNKAKGDAFENYIVSLFDTVSGRFKLMEWRSDKIADTGMYAQNSRHPDLQFEFIGDNNIIFKFAIECKWRSRFLKNGIEWAYPKQIENYLQYEKKNKIKVYVAIGVGGTSDSPAELYLIPLQNAASYPTLFESYLKNFKRNPTHHFFYQQHTQSLM